MIINFCIRGRLGNAIFRYMASVIMCIHFDGIYNVENTQNQNVSDEEFAHIMEILLQKKENKIFIKHDLNMNGFYQHDLIYKTNKKNIADFINNHQDHFVMTDGVNAGDKQYEKFYMTDILNTPSTFSKKYKNVLHIRLEDFVTHNLYVKVERIIELLEKNIVSDSLCIVCKKPVSSFETSYIKSIQDYVESTGNLQFFIEHNDTITDYYVMKEAEILICSKSTLSWCAAYFSDKIKKCYLPDYNVSVNSTCKYPIDNTELY